MTHARIAARLSVFLVLTTLILAVSAQGAFAGRLLGELRSWSPHGDASTAGWTTVVGAENLGSGTGDDWGPEVKFKAHNAKTAFYDTGSTPGQYVKLSRNEFFKRVGEHHPIDIRWAWRGSDEQRYRFIKSIRGIIAGA